VFITAVPTEIFFCPEQEGASRMVLGNRYRAIRLLGSGGYGSVYEAEDIETHQRVAVKQSNLPDVEDDPTDQVFLVAIGHPFVVYGHHDLTSRHAISPSAGHSDGDPSRGDGGSAAASESRSFDPRV
jgi:serine/threonine protein kinase